MRLRSFKSIAIATILALPTMLPGVTAIAGENARMWNVPVVAADREGAPAVAPALGLVTMPSTWAAGDTAAVLLVDLTDRNNAVRDRLVAELLGEGVEVLEILLPEQPQTRLPILFSAMRELSNAGAGRVLALGTGAAGQSVVEAAEPGIAARHLRGRGPNLEQPDRLRVVCRIGAEGGYVVVADGNASAASVEGEASCLQRLAGKTR